MSAKKRKPGKRGTSKDPNRPRVVEFPTVDDSVALEDSQPGPALVMESLIRVIQPMLDSRDFERPEDVETFLDHISEADFLRARAALMENNPREQAQQLAYQAMLEAESDEEATTLARRALELDPQCLDARMLAAELESGEDVGEFIAAMEEIVADGRAALGEEFFEEHRDDLWEAIEARPYLRARYRLAEALRISGHIGDAIAHLEGLLDLNPRDHQRARDDLLACYLAQDNIAGARTLLFQFAGDNSAAFHWGRILERYISEDPAGALEELQRARRQNRYTDRYMTFRRDTPDLNPDAYTPGSEEEAVHCLYIMGLAWANYPEAIHWVRGH